MKKSFLWMIIIGSSLCAQEGPMSKSTKMFSPKTKRRELLRRQSSPSFTQGIASITSPRTSSSRRSSLNPIKEPGSEEILSVLQDLLESQNKMMQAQDRQATALEDLARCAVLSVLTKNDNQDVLSGNLEQLARMFSGDKNQTEERANEWNGETDIMLISLLKKYLLIKE